MSLCFSSDQFSCDSLGTRITSVPTDVGTFIDCEV